MFFWITENFSGTKVFKNVFESLKFFPGPQSLFGEQKSLKFFVDHEKLEKKTF